MKVPYSWLSDFVDLHGVDVHEVARLLTLHTCEVEAVHEVGGGLDAIVVGEVVGARKHPNADSLTLTQVDVGGGERLPIVCGAPNVRTGQKVAVAVPGVRLPSGLEIGERKIRGEVSRGMICSERELGLGDEHDGILVLEDAAEVGNPLTSLPSIHDWVIEIDNKSVNHRPDLWGIRGFGREVAALVHRVFEEGPDWLNRFLHDCDEHPSNAQGHFPVEVLDPGRCPRYMAAVVEGVRVAPSPPWMQRRLRQVGARPISNIVDVTNYVLFELGQPTHAFDRETIRGGAIQVRTARAGESLVTLDGQTRRLAVEDLLICDREGPIGIAGVMGGANSEVSPRTQNVVLESATFAAGSIRRTAARLGLRSEASARFEKGLPWTLARVALARIWWFIAEQERMWGPNATFGPSLTDLVGGKPPKVDSTKEETVATGGWTSRRNVNIPGDRESRRIELRWDFLSSRLGVEPKSLDRGEVREILESLGIGVRDWENREGLDATIPYFRATKDLTEPIDLVEEIARIRGYDRIAPRALEAPVVPPPSQGDRRWLVRRVEDRLVNLGFRGLETYSFVSDALASLLGIEGEPFVRLSNSMVAGESRVRRELLPSLLGLLTKNAPYERELRLFEVGKGYRPEHPRLDPYGDVAKGEPLEVHAVAALLTQPLDASGGVPPFDAGAFFAAKGALRAFLEGLAVEATFARPTVRPPYLHPQHVLEVRVGDRALGILGEIHPRVLRALRGDGSAAGFELDLAPLEAAVLAAGPRRFPGLPRFPGILVDVALAAPDSMAASALESLVRAAAPDLCRGLTLFDIYRGPELGAGRRSVAFHVELRADDRTLNDADENRFLAALAQRAAAEGIELRGWKDAPSRSRTPPNDTPQAPLRSSSSP